MKNLIILLVILFANNQSKAQQEYSVYKVEQKSISNPTSELSYIMQKGSQLVLLFKSSVNETGTLMLNQLSLELPNGKRYFANSSDLYLARSLVGGTETYFAAYFEIPKFVRRFSIEESNHQCCFSEIDLTLIEEIEYDDLGFLTHSAQVLLETAKNVGTVSFYLSNLRNWKQSMVSFSVDGEYIGDLASFFPKSKTPVAGQDGTLNIRLVAGLHTFRATDGVFEWNGEIVVPANDGVILKGLTK